MPPVEKPKSEPLVLLLDEIEILSAQTRLMELYLKRAQSASFGEVENIQEQFRAEVTNLKARLEDKENTITRHLSTFDDEQKQLNTQNQDLLQRIAAQENLLQQRDVAARQMEQSAQDRIRSLAQELAKSRESAEEQRAEIQRAESERHELRQRITQLESARGQIQVQAERDGEALRRDTQAKSAALQSEIGHKTALLTRHQSTIAELERRLKVSAAATGSEQANKQALLENQAEEIARRDTDIAALKARIAELASSAAQQQLAAADELAQARETFAAELRETRQLLEQRRGDLQHVEQELRNRNRELQGKLAAKESVVESLEDNLRQAQVRLLAARDALGEKERALAEWQARLSEQEQNFLAERHDWQCQLAEKQLRLENYRGEIDRATVELAAALERQGHELDERTEIDERARRLTLQVAALAGQLNEKQQSLDSQSATLRQSEARVAELSAALDGAREALAEQQLRAQRDEQVFATGSAELREELERKEQALNAQQAAAHRAEPAFKAHIEDLESRLNEKAHMLEARAREIGVLQARVESLSGQAARLEAANSQIQADAARDTDRVRQELQAEITGWHSASAEQRALLDERQAALSAIERELRAEIDLLKEQSAGRQTLLDKQTAELRQAETEANRLRQRGAELESTIRQIQEAPALPAATDANRIAALEQQLDFKEQELAELAAALRRMEQQAQSPAGEPHPETARSGAADQSEQLSAAQNRIDELIERLAQLEAARHTLQENAGHELQQLRESFESRIEKLRMELAAKNQMPAKDQPMEDHQAAITGLAEGSHRQIQELQGQLTEKHNLLENRNEELIKVKAEMDSLQDYLARLKTSHEQEKIDAPFSVDLREEDAVETPRRFVNGSPVSSLLRPDPLQLSGAEPGTNMAGGVIGHAMSGAKRTNRFTHLDGRVRSWNPEPETDSASGSGRRWNMGLFKRRWKA